MRNVLNLFLVSFMVLALGLAGCELSEDSDADDVYGETVDNNNTTNNNTTGVCGDDGKCNNSNSCGGGSPKSWAGNTDGDCPGCTCNYYSNVCEAGAKGSSTNCACDYDCTGKQACSDDGHCDSWCPAGTDPNCDTCTCDYNENVCEVSTKCSLTGCNCDVDCYNGVFEPCGADNHCDSWCTTGADPDCAGDPNDGKYCN